VALDMTRRDLQATGMPTFQAARSMATGFMPS
jgi:hypothetical protein